MLLKGLLYVLFTEENGINFAQNKTEKKSLLCSFCHLFIGCLITNDTFLYNNVLSKENYCILYTLSVFLCLNIILTFIGDVNSKIFSATLVKRIIGASYKFMTGYFYKTLHHWWYKPKQKNKSHSSIMLNFLLWIICFW